MVHNEQQLIVPIRHVIELRVVGPRPVSLYIFLKITSVYHIKMFLTFFLCFQHTLPQQIEIDGYINKAKAAYRRWDRNLNRFLNDRDWVRNDELEDYWDLQILFGERTYIPERWV
jgi:hypothetical protein